MRAWTPLRLSRWLLLGLVVGLLCLGSLPAAAWVLVLWFAALAWRMSA